jgi:chloramphenicol O-acetyltransferase
MLILGNIIFWNAVQEKFTIFLEEQMDCAFCWTTSHQIQEDYTLHTHYYETRLDWTGLDRTGPDRTGV